MHAALGTGMQHPLHVWGVCGQHIRSTSTTRRGGSMRLCICFIVSVGEWRRQACLPILGGLMYSECRGVMQFNVWHGIILLVVDCMAGVVPGRTSCMCLHVGTVLSAAMHALQ
jgi:hypothetical protein